MKIRWPTTAGQWLRALGAGLVATEVSPPQEVRRGRRFVHAYVGFLVLAGAAFGTLLLLARDQSPLLRIDLPIAVAIQRVDLPAYGWLLTLVSTLGFFPLNAITYFVLFLLFLLARLRLEAVLLVGSSLLAGVVGSVLRHVVGRARPSADLVHVARQIDSYGFPSGHVIQYTTLFGFAFYVVMVAWRGGVPRTLALVGLALLVVLAGPSRVYLGAHWPSDTLGAYLLAGLWLAGTIELHLALKPRLAGW